MNNTIGRSELVLKYLGFLVTEYNMQFKAQEFDEYLGFHFMSYTYSFYNENGCFTIHHIPQRGETGWFVSKTISEDQYELLKKEIIQSLYVHEQTWIWRIGIKNLARSIRSQIARSGEFFGIKVR